ncbi:ORC-CDC6 family AAA ATPase [Paenibacillus jiagnxiensis]|uniref:ORC-CDC6 family AAA ATPase n=1 Tax=Paenibacillus jiagnxiensis TaxID=3228926 RepID=UPI0033A11159
MSKGLQAVSWIRTEDIDSDDLLDYYVPSFIDENILSAIMGSTPILLVGSRGTGKTMLLKVAEKRLTEKFKTDRVLPLEVSFSSSPFVEPRLFRPWMLAKIMFQLQRKLSKLGLISSSTSLFRRYTGIDIDDDNLGEKINKFIVLLENSWKAGNGFVVNDEEIRTILGSSIQYIDALNETDYFKALIEDLCEAFDITRINVFFDEAAHNFMPNQQREFFSLFRDLRFSKFCGIAAVYPGLTTYGATFQSFHDAIVVKVDRNIDSPDYVNTMEDIVKVRVDEKTWGMLKNNGESLHALIYASSGNPRYLLKSLTVATENLTKFRTSNVSEVIRDFYRADIWNEHTRLAKTYAGHKPLIDWGRNFIEGTVLPETKQKNDDRDEKKEKVRTIYFVVHREAPAAILAAIRILEYSGIVRLHSEGVKMTRSELGDRYALNLGIILAQESKPIPKATEIRRGLTNKRFTEFGFNHPTFKDLAVDWSIDADIDMKSALESILTRPIEDLDISEFLYQKLKNDLEVNTIGEVLVLTEDDLMKVFNIGVKRSRKIMSVAVNAALEYVSG